MPDETKDAEDKVTETPDAETPDTETPDTEVNEDPEVTEEIKSEEATESNDGDKVTEEPEEPEADDALTAILAKFGEQLNAIQERQEALEARIKAEDEAKAVAVRAAKLGIPADLLTIDRDANPEAFVKALQAYAQGQLPASKAPTPTLPSVGHGEPGGAVQTVDEMLRAAEAEGNHEAISVFKAMKLSDAASKMI